MWGAEGGIARLSIMAKIVQALTRASKEYDPITFQSLVRDLDAVINKLNTSFQQELQQEIQTRKLSLLNNGSYQSIQNVWSHKYSGRRSY